MCGSFVLIQLSTANDDSRNSPAKVSDFRNKFEKFGDPKPVVRKPLGGTAAGVESGTDKTDSLDKTVKEAHDLADQLRKELAEQERVRLEDRQEFLKKMEFQRIQFENEMKVIKERNNMVSQVTWKVRTFRTWN